MATKTYRKSFVLMTILFVVASFGISFFFSTCKKADPCDGVVCQNGGTIIPSGDHCGCNCAVGYEGPFCQTISRDKVIGNYTTSGMENYSNPYISSISADAASIDRIDLLFNQSPSCLFTLYATIRGNTITIPTQTAGNINAIIMGSGSVTSAPNGNFFINIHLTIDGVTSTCISNGQYSATWVKQ